MAIPFIFPSWKNPGSNPLFLMNSGITIETINNNENMNNRYFRISSFYPAAFLLAKGAELIDIDKISNSRRADFVFAEPMFCEQLLRAFNYGKENDETVMVDARKMAVATKTLKEKLYQRT